MTPADACHEPTPAELADLFRPEELDWIGAPADRSDIEPEPHSMAPRS